MQLHAEMTHAEFYQRAVSGQGLAENFVSSVDPATGVLLVVYAKNPRKAIRKVARSVNVTDGTVRLAREDYDKDGVLVQLEIHP